MELSWDSITNWGAWLDFYLIEGSLRTRGWPNQVMIPNVPPLWGVNFRATFSKNIATPLMRKQQGRPTFIWSRKLNIAIGNLSVPPHRDEINWGYKVSTAVGDESFSCR